MPQIKSCSKIGEVQDDIASEVLTWLVYLCHLAVFQELLLCALFIHCFNGSRCCLTVGSVFYSLLNHI